MTSETISSAIAIIDKEMRKHGLDNIETLVSDCDIPVEDRSVDIVYLHNMLPLITRKKRGVARNAAF
jgi:hypothetical protein